MCKSSPRDVKHNNRESVLRYYRSRCRCRRRWHHQLIVPGTHIGIVRQSVGGAGLPDKACESFTAERTPQRLPQRPNRGRRRDFNRSIVALFFQFCKHFDGRNARARSRARIRCTRIATHNHISNSGLEARGAACGSTSALHLLMLVFSPFRPPFRLFPSFLLSTITVSRRQRSSNANNRKV